MKLNKILSVLAIGFFCFFVKAQEKLTYGIQGGINYSSLRFEDVRTTKHDAELNYFIGISSRIHLRTNMFLDIEVNYDRKKVSVYLEEVIINSLSYGGGFRIFDIYEFITLPVMLRYEFGKKKIFFVKGGPFLGYFLSAKERINNGELSMDLSQYFSDFDFGFSIGIGKVFSLGNSNKLNLELRNNLGITSIQGHPESQYTKTNSLNIVLGWIFIH